MKTRVLVKERDLDSDARSEWHIEVDAPVEPALQRTQLIETVQSRHPGARIKTFRAGVAASSANST